MADMPNSCVAYGWDVTYDAQGNEIKVWRDPMHPVVEVNGVVVRDGDTIIPPSEREEVSDG